MFTNWTNTLGKKIGLYISILSILLFSILLFIITSYVKNITLDMNESLVKEQLNTITLEVNQFFTDSFLSIEQLAFNKDVETLLSEITDAENGIFHRNYGDVLDHLTRIKKKNSILSGTWVFDIDSKYMLNSYALDVDSSYNPQSQEWYIDIIDNQKPYSITAPYSDVITGNKIVSLALPVYKKDKIVGIAGADLFVYRITDTLKEKVLGTSGYVSLFTGEQEVIHYQDNENMFKQLSELDIDPLLLSYIESNDSAKMLSYKDHGTKFYGLTTKLPINGWIVLGSLPQNDISSTITPVITMLMLILIMGLIIIILATLFLTHRETKDFKLIRHYCNNLANGDFTFSIQPTLKKRRDELGSLANHFEGMKNNLAQLISQISTSSFAVDHSSGNLLHGLMDMSRSSHDLANNIGEVAVGATAQALEIQHGLEKTEELEIHLSHNKQCATSIKDSSKEVSTAIHEGNTILQDLIENTNHIVSSSQSINHLMKDIENQSKHIEEMNRLISNITEETNLLSLNASIEAARVGQAGLGFAVVAKEIRKLADQSAASTSNINTVVYDIKSLIKDAVGQVEHNTKIALLQLNYVEETQSKYKAITTAMEQVKKDIISLNHTGEDITSSKDTLREILETVAAVAEESASNTQESAASVEEQSSTVQDLTIASQNLSDLATQLKEAIAQFNI